jgi:hypothetical protein
MGTLMVTDPLTAIPDPDAIRRQIGETATRLSLLRRLLKVAERKAKAIGTTDGAARCQEAARAS